MRFDFLTPEIFNMLVIANLIVGLALIAYRFTHDMQRPIPTPEQQRQQIHDELSTNALDDKSPQSEQILQGEESPAQNQQNKG
ncbi:MAG: hypothetical protein Q9P01_20870 [Anaerolineae bacterium]|nr:hypothetical protein [Anaerolineae bacterium]MDQ7037202.1 hypothetical protein [Anaerolineae bacterium]